MKNLMTTVIAGSQYLLHPQKLGTIQETINPDALIPITLLTTQEIFDSNLEATLDRFARQDDVFVSAFGNVLVEKTSDNSTSSISTAQYQDRETYHLDTSQFEVLAQINELPSGPYILHGPDLYQAWKVYQDEVAAFAFGVIPDDVKKPETYRALPTLSENGATKAIGVPSRLYSRLPSKEKPLSGKRIAITDSISLEGTIKTLSSRAFGEVYDRADTSSADLVSKLVNLGAVIVGKTKTSPLLSGMEWVDEEKPFNPRGDGYQDPAVNAAGAGSALGEYSWLDGAIGQSSLEGLFDTAVLDGIFSLRPTQDEKALANVEISSRRYDTLDWSARSLDALHNLTQTNSKSTSSLKPNTVIYIQDFAVPSKEDRNATNNFILAVEKSLQLKPKVLSLKALWALEPPKEARGAGLEEYLKDAPFSSYAYDYYHQFDHLRRLFRQRYHETPFVEAVPLYRWSVGQNITEDQYKELSSRVTVFQTWFSNNVASLDGDDTIVILPCFAKSWYRNDDPVPPPFIHGLDPEVLSAVLGTPLIAAPVGQVPYISKISGKTEYRAVCGSLMGQREQEAGLVEVLKEIFTSEGWETEVKVGDTMFT